MTPRDWDLLTVEEEDQLLDWLDDYIEQMEKARNAKR
jgi:hypothetical protein